MQSGRAHQKKSLLMAISFFGDGADSLMWMGGIGPVFYFMASNTRETAVTLRTRGLNGSQRVGMAIWTRNQVNTLQRANFAVMAGSKKDPSGSFFDF
jgi:hypothetical protein